ncbi:hypothetical protein OIU76_016089 [Salix suchowensis]|nr:hypothetical protein OIU76_016089 [Salix suchowensis]
MTDNSKTRLEAPVNRVDGLHKVMEKDSHNGSDRDTVRDIEIVELIHDQESKGNSSENSVGSSNEGSDISQISDNEVDARVWEPPEAEDPEDDLDGGVAFIDDDDEECGDGTEWGKPSSLRGGGSGSFKFKEEKQKAMEEVVNGKFKGIVSQLLKTAGVGSEVRGGESWLDIVTSLSWEAASFLKPEAVDGKAMDLDVYVKVKCIATGSRIESQVVAGLVFKKHAAHKHMPTKYKNPRLLLIRGVLGHSSSVLSSFKSMEQEKDNLKSLVETIEMCHPNVVLVEKSVSRDVQESILAKGMTLIYDMKLHRLKRGLGEGGKKPSKTLMFIEGCPTHLGCTILLKGSHSDELKRVKYVVHFAVVIAYHLILETSFLVDWKAMFSSAIFAGAANNSSRNLQSSILGNSIPSVEESTTETGSSTIDIPISNGFHEDASLKKVVGDNLPLVSSSPYQSLPDCFGLNGKEIIGQIMEDVPLLKTMEAPDLFDMEGNKDSNKEKPVDGHPQSLSHYSEASLDRGKNINAALASQSILVLMSRRNALKRDYM